MVFLVKIHYGYLDGITVWWLTTKLMPNHQVFIEIRNLETVPLIFFFFLNILNLY